MTNNAHHEADLGGFTVAAARAYAQRGRLEAWIHAYLLGGEWANAPLSSGLKLQRRWWRGPIEVNLDAVKRCCGPEREMEFRVDAAAWATRTHVLAQGFERLEAMPPLIAEYRDGVLSVRDGNHRHEAIRRKGWQTCWVIIWYNSESDFTQDAGRTRSLE